MDMHAYIMGTVVLTLQRHEPNVSRRKPVNPSTARYFPYRRVKKAKQLYWLPLEEYVDYTVVKGG